MKPTGKPQIVANSGWILGVGRSTSFRVKGNSRQSSVTLHVMLRPPVIYPVSVAVMACRVKPLRRVLESLILVYL